MATDFFDYTSEELAAPEGSNALGAFALFYWRFLYQQNQLDVWNYPDLSRRSVYYNRPEVPKALDTWYDKILFGRVDRKQSSITLKEEKLASITSAKSPNILAADFVVAAFEDFVQHMKKAAILGRLDTENSNQAMYEIEATRAYVSPLIAYGGLHDMAIRAYIAAATPAQQRKIYNYKAFRKDYIRYLFQLASIYPVTKSSFLTSPHSSPMVSGLTISIANLPADDDSIKASDFINDPNFSFYARAAKKFGFIINKNAPWLLTADLFSNAILAYFPAGVNKDNFFDIYYNRCYKTDLEYLRRIIHHAYTEFIRIWPFVEINEQVCPKSSYNSFVNSSALTYGGRKHVIADPALGPVVEAFPRAPITPAAAELDFPLSRSLDFYVRLRQIETDHIIRDARGVAQRAREILCLNQQPSWSSSTPSQVQRMRKASKYIDVVFRDYTYNRLYLNLLYPYEVLDTVLDQVETGITTETAVLEVLAALRPDLPT
jgi:hypothetical protein